MCNESEKVGGFRSEIKSVSQGIFQTAEGR